LKIKFLIFLIALFVGAVGTAQAATLACGRGVLFDREYVIRDHPDHTAVGGVNRHERHWSIFRFTNPNPSSDATISQVIFINPDGTTELILGAGGDPFPGDFSPTIGPKSQSDLDMRDVFPGTPPLFPGEDQILTRLIVTSDRKVVGKQIRVTFGFEPPVATYGLQEERGRVILDCVDK